MADETLGDRLRKAKKAKRAGNAAIATAAGVSEVTVSRWLNDKTDPQPRELDAAAAFLGVTSHWLRYGTQADAAVPARGRVSELSAEPYAPNPRYRKRLPPRAYQRVYDYLATMEAAGATHEQLDEAERVMIDGAYNKLNTRDVRDRTEDELIVDIDAAWVFIRDVLRNSGIKLP